MSPRVFIATVLLVPLLAACATTSKVMLGPSRPAIAVEQVKVYQVPPRRYEEIARLDASSAIGFGTQGQTNAAIDRLARAAAALGANGVLLLGVDTMRPPVSVGVGAGAASSHVGAFGSVGIPTAQRHAAGIAIHVIED